MPVRSGIYEHFQGRRYRVLGTFTRRDGGDQIVAYYGLENDRMLEWLPLAEFVETVRQDGYEGPRFRPLKCFQCKRAAAVIVSGDRDAICAACGAAPQAAVAGP